MAITELFVLAHVALFALAKIFARGLLFFAVGRFLRRLGGAFAGGCVGGIRGAKVKAAYARGDGKA